MANLSGKTNKMKAIIISKKGKILYKDVKDFKTIPENYVKIKVMAAGLCGSDIQKLFYDSLSLRKVKSPIWGHEIAGIVDKKGLNVKSLNIGDAVVVNPLITSNLKNFSIGKEVSGGFAQFVLVPESNLLTIPPKLSFSSASLLDSIASSLHAYNLVNAPCNKKIAIIGDGPLALSLVIIAQQNRNEVFLIGKNKKNMILAKKFGAKVFFWKNRHKLSADSIDYVFEAVGGFQDDTLNYAIDLIRKKGSIVVLGVFGRNYFGKILFRNLFFKEGKVIGSNSFNTFNGVDEFKSALGYLVLHQNLFSQIITHELPLCDFARALSLIKNKSKSNAIKIIFKPQND
jgi:L-iditol 2-dehydrogenase